jgi:hypothetical protein
MLILAGPVQAKAPAQTVVTDTAWWAQYWNNMNQSGLPALERYEATLNHDWGHASPDATINIDHFSARWRRYVNFQAGVYRFTATSDDGIRVRVDGDLIIDAWYDHPATTFTSDESLSAGSHLVSVEYYDSAGQAVASLAWQAVASPIRAWRGEYYNNQTLSGQPALVRDDAQINFNWGAGSPAPGAINSDGFSARWTRTLNLTPGQYHFTVFADDGARLWVNNQLLVDAWQVQSARSYSADVQITGNSTTIRLEYFENAGVAAVQLAWTQAAAIVNWRGEYYDNMTLSGAPLLVRDDSQINFDWGSSSPAPGQIHEDGFSARWTRTPNLTAGWYRFTLRVDDGARLWVNDQLLIDAWQVQSATTLTQDVYVPGGATSLRMEYYENSGLASARLDWAAAPVPISNWRGEYYPNENLQGAPALVRDDAQIQFNWGDSSPIPDLLNADAFSARWTRTLNLPAGVYRFTMIVDDGARLWINDRLVLDGWQLQGPTPYQADLTLDGNTNIRMEYFEHGGTAVAQLSWQLVSNPSAPNTQIVDDTDIGFVKSGPASDWHTAPDGYNGSMVWTRTTHEVGADTNLGLWYPTLTPGRYEVFVFVPFYYTTSSSARYMISHVNGVATVTLNQSRSGGQWVSLGIYQFRGTRDDYVALSDTTGDSQTQLVGYDAIRWEPR